MHDASVLLQLFGGGCGKRKGCPGRSTSQKTKQVFGHGARCAESVTIRHSLGTSTGSRVKRREKAE